MAETIDKTTKKQTVLVFHAPKRPNAKGELNWDEFVEVDKLDLSTLQSLVGCETITLLPNIDPNTKLLAFCRRKWPIEKRFYEK